MMPIDISLEMREAANDAIEVNKEMRGSVNDAYRRH